MNKVLSQYLGTEGNTGDASQVMNLTGMMAKWQDTINKYAVQYGLDAKLMAAIIFAESSGDQRATEPTGPHYGLFQFAKSTFVNVCNGADYSTETVDISRFPSVEEAMYDGDTNIHAGAIHLKHTLEGAGLYGGHHTLQEYMTSDVLYGQWESVRGKKFIDTYTALESFGSSLVNDPFAANAINTGLTGSNNIALKFVDAALNMQGAPYVWGGGHNPPFSNPDDAKSTGVDCSGLLDSAWVQAGLPGNGPGDTHAWRAASTTSTTLDANTKAGAILFAYNDEHMGLAIGNGQYIHAPQPGETVKQGALPGFWSDAAIHPSVGTSDQPGTGAGAGLSSNDPNKNVVRAAFNTYYLLPQLLTGMQESVMFTGDKAPLNDVALQDIVKTVCKGSMRRYCSTPAGQFLAFFPDYFGIIWKDVFFRIEDIEVQDMNIDWTDKWLKTHVYCAGDITTVGGIDELIAFYLTPGVVSYNQTGLMELLLNVHLQDNSEYSPKNFLDRFGVRPQKEPMVSWIGSPTFEYFYSLHQFLLYWSRQFSTDVKISFMPEIFPGVRVGFAPEHDLSVFVEQVTHRCSYEQGFTTTLKIVAPCSEGGANIGMPMAQDSSASQERSNEANAKMHFEMLGNF